MKPLVLLTNEKIMSRLPASRLMAGFRHNNGVLVVTNQRLLFAQFGIMFQPKRWLVIPLSALKSLQISNGLIMDAPRLSVTYVEDDQQKTVQFSPEIEVNLFSNLQLPRATNSASARKLFNALVAQYGGKDKAVGSVSSLAGMALDVATSNSPGFPTFIERRREMWRYNGMNTVIIIVYVVISFILFFALKKSTAFAVAAVVVGIAVVYVSFKLLNSLRKASARRYVIIDAASKQVFSGEQIK